MRSATRRGVGAWSAVILGFVAASVAWATPPKVIKAVPDNGQEDVDPATKQIQIVFDQPMSPGGMSIVGGGEKFPKIIGKPRWTNDRTIVAIIQLEPDHEYWLSINSDKFTNFRSKTGEAAEPYPISFHTKGGKAAQTAKLTPEINRKAVQELRDAMDKSYSYRDLHKLDWDKLFNEAAAKLEAAQTPRQFAQETGKLLARNQDMHLWLKVGQEQVPTFRRSVQPNCMRAGLPQVVPGFTKRSNIVFTGKFPDGIGYILITAWDSKDPEQLKGAYEALAACDGSKGLIVDVRPNSGGAEPLAQQFAGCFIDKPRVYGKHVIRENGKFSEMRERKFGPTANQPKYRGKVAVLTGQAVMSSCESFLLMMKQVPGCKLVGEKSYGSSGNPQPVELSNGVTVYLPCWKDLRPNGTCFEGEGIAPDIEVKTRPDDFANGDPVLAAALKWLRGSAGAGR